MNKLTQDKEVSEVKSESKELKTSESEKMWSEIENLPMNIFSLPNQKVSDHTKKVSASGDNLLLKPKSSAVVPALEEAIGSGFDINLADNGYILVTRAVKPVTVVE